MKKSSLLISAVLTTFVLAILGGVFRVNHAFSSSTPASTLQATEVPGVLPATVAAPAAPAAPTIQAFISPQEAAQIAARFTGYGKLYSVESTLFGGTNTYKVTFSSGNLAYVDLQGKLVAAFLAPRASISSKAPLVASNSSGSPSDSSPSISVSVSNSVPSSDDPVVVPPSSSEPEDDDHDDGD